MSERITNLLLAHGWAAQTAALLANATLAALLPLEIYAFTKSTAWVEYETTQADIFDHILAVVPQFDLRLFQSPAGHDLAARD